MKILITGVAGFVGRYLLKELAEHTASGNEIFGFGIEDITSDELDGMDDYARINITDAEVVRNYLKRNKPDVIYHLAAVSSVAVSIKQPVETFRINQLGTLHLLDAAVRELESSPRILLVGSGDLYRSLPEDIPMTEETPFEPRNPYAASKAAVDNIGDIYGLNYGLQIIRTRSFNHIGPGQQTTFVMSSFASQIAQIENGRQEPVLFAGNLDVKRDFTDVRDVVHAYRLLMEKGIPGEAYNVCSNNACEIRKMLEILLEFSSVDIEVRKDPARMRKADNPILYGDNSKLQSHTGWKPSIPIKETLEDLLNSWREKEKNAS